MNTARSLPLDKSHAMEIVKWRPFEKNTLKAFFSLRLPSGLQLNDLAYHVKSDTQGWVGFPARPYETENGTKAWVPLVEVPDRETLRAFQRAALEAIDTYLEEAE